MIQTQTILKVADNSGVKTVKCIKVIGNSKVANVGDCILVSVRSIKTGFQTSTNLTNKRSTKTNIKKGQIYKALIIRTKKSICTRANGHQIVFQSNDVILLSNTGTKDNLIGSRIFGPITRELRVNGFKQALSQAKRLI